jgi:Ca2+-binding RTX toxin-like protein
VSVNADGEAILSDHETIVRTFTFAAPFEVEHIELDLVNVSHTWTGDIEISLTSPSGMAGLWVPMGFGTYSETWTFDSVQFWGENGAGTWTLTVRDNANFDVGQLGTFTLRLYGSAASANDLYVYTDEFNEMFALDADQRGALNDGDGGVDTLNAAALTSGSIVDLAGGTSRIDGHALAIAGGTIENVHGGDAGDRLSGSMAANSLFGGRGDDIVLGDPLGAAGGSDRLEGGAGIDWIDGGGGGDTGTGGAGADVLVGQAGDDVLSGNAGEDGLSGQGGADTLYGGTEGDVLDGGAGDDALHGDEGRDWLNGGAGNDRMWGGDGIDVLLGGEGADVLRGGAGDDMVSGGAGNDVFAFDGLSGHDTVSDFQDGVDLLHFAYDSFTAFQAAGGFIGALAVDGTQIVGDGATQVMVVLAGAGGLTQADLLFGAPP